MPVREELSLKRVLEALGRVSSFRGESVCQGTARGTFGLWGLWLSRDGRAGTETEGGGGLLGKQTTSPNVAFSSRASGAFGEGT